jgi:eukaryotic-like serine/threonine-protein kinase
VTEGATGRLLADRYRLTERIGAGGMGTVYRAHDTRLDRPVAVKLLRTADDDIHRARLQAEARFAGSLRHPGIVQVFDYGEEHSTPYLVMELVDGTPLPSPLPPDRLAQVLAGVGEALAAAHAAGVVHRDLKPSNILLTATGQPVLVDFGVARSDGAEPLTDTGFVVGTADYLSPEQVEGSRATPASDVYALGVVAHQCLTGTSPFHRETPIATALAHLRDPTPELPGGVPTGLRTLVRAMLARAPEARPSAAEVAARAAVAPRTRTVVLPPMPKTPPAPPQVVSPWARRRIAVVAAMVALLCGGLVVAALEGQNPAAPTASAARAGGTEKAASSARTTPTPTITPTSTPTATETKPPPPAPAAGKAPKAGKAPQARGHDKKPKKAHPGKGPKKATGPKKHGKHR